MPRRLPQCSPRRRCASFSSPHHRAPALKNALISVDQLVLKVHAQFNSRFKDQPAAKRKPETCSYCKGAVGPNGHTIKSCPKKQSDEAGPAPADAATCDPVQQAPEPAARAPAPQKEASASVPRPDCAATQRPLRRSSQTAVYTGQDESDDE
eukprot:7377319-Prymnesium_polylepis.1